MKLTFISPSPPDLYSPGIRILSSYLKQHGHQVRMIFLPGGVEHLNFESSFIYQYKDSIIKEVIELSKDSDLIGISFMTLYFDRAVQLTKRLKQALDIPISWGGIHPTLRPEEALEYADMVCVGEGEEAVLELCNKINEHKDYTDTAGFWFKVGDKIIKNDIRPLIEDLDSLPFQDYTLEDDYVYSIFEDKMVKITNEFFEKISMVAPDLKGNFFPSYKVMTTRGCPHNCSYCCSSVLKNQLYPKKYLRRRSVENVMLELEDIKRRFPYIGVILIFDDVFFMASKEYIQEFASEYKKRIALPFHAQCSPTTTDEDKLEILMDAGLIFVEMGIQTGSKSTQKLFDRTFSNDRILQAACAIGKYSDRMLSPCYHIILDIPWESDEETLETLKLIMQLPRPYWLKFSSLIFFPETGLYHLAKKEGLITDELKDVYRKPFTYPSGKYVNYLVYLSGFCYFPRWVSRILITKPLFNFFSNKKFNKMFLILFKITEVIAKVGKGFRALFTGKFAYLGKQVSLRIADLSKGSR